jgi:hypothetical protein
MRGSITLADVAAKADVLDVACSQCERTGRYEVATLIERHGWLFTVPELLREVSIDCVRRASVSQHDLCGVHCPELAALFLRQLQSEMKSEAKSLSTPHF